VRDPRRALTVLLLVGAAFAAHARALGAGFVYDDHRFVVHNPAIESLSPLAYFADPRTASAEAGIEPDVYRPLRTLHFAVDRALFGLREVFWHLGNVLLHALVAVLAWVLLLRVVAPGAGRAGRVAAALGALLFAVHPVTAEAVAWVSSRGDLLAMLLVLSGLEVLRRTGVARTVGGAALVALGCLAKESAVVAFAWLPLRDLALPRTVRPPLRTTLARSGLLLAVAVAYLVVRGAVMEAAGGRPLAQVDLPEGSRLLTVATSLSAVAWYAKALVLPSGFPLEHDLPPAASFAEPSVVVGLGLVLTLLLAGVTALRRGRGALALGCLAPLAALVPVSNVVVPLKTFAAERFLYPALPFVAVLAALGLRRLLSVRDRRVAVAAGAVAVALLAALGAGTWARERPWRDDLSLWTAVARADPSNPRAYEGLGYERWEAGDTSGAERAYGTYLESAPDDGKTLAALGDVFGTVAVEREVAAGMHDPNDPLAFEGVRPEDIDPSRSGTRQTLTGALYARRRQIEAYQRALSTWERVGLAAGRGSPTLRRRTLEALRFAARKIGDLPAARLANALLLRDDERTSGAPGHAQRREQVFLALLAVGERPRSETPVSEAEREGRARIRAELLRDVGVDPHVADADARDALLPAMTALLRERGDDPALRRARAAALRRRAGNRPTSEVEGDLRLALEDLRWLVARDPGDTVAAAHLTELKRRLGER
jgi:hypothetical protein